jgi:hypothetical protein
MTLKDGTIKSMGLQIGNLKQANKKFETLCNLKADEVFDLQSQVNSLKQELSTT